MRELRLASRRLRRRPGSAAATVLALAIGIGATTAAYSAVDGVALRDLPVAAQDELVVAWYENPERGSLEIPFGPRSFEAVRRGTTSLTSIAGFSAWGTAPSVVDAPGEGHVLQLVRVAGDYFGVLGALPAVGRLLDSADDEVGAAPAAVLSHSAWSNRYTADADVVGSTILLDGVATTIVGVAPRGLDFPVGADLWIPYRVDYASDETPHEMHIVARRAAGATLATVRADIGAALGLGPPEDRDFWAAAVPVIADYEDAALGAVRPILTAGLVAALLLLAAAVANATLFSLAGGRVAAHDLAVRRALGAGRVPRAQRVAADACLLGALAGGAGLGVAWAALRFLRPLAPPGVPRLDLVALDWRSVIAAAVATILAAGVAVASASVGLGRLHAGALLSSASRGPSGEQAGLRQVVAGLQVALAAVSAVGAGLLLRTVDNLNRIEPGFSASDMTAVALRVPYDWFAVPEAYLGALEEVVRDLEGRPGIVAARPTLGPPLEQRLEVVLTAEGQTEEESAANPYVAVDAVLPGHFQALGIPLLAGRPITDLDNRADADPVAVVDEVLARALWPGENPLGKRINGFGHFDTWFTVVGVVAGTRYRELLAPHPRAYYPLRRLGNAPPAALLVRAEGGTPVFDLARETFTRIDPNVRVYDARPMPEVLRRPTMARRFAASILVTFAAAVLLLAALGVYGAFTVSVQERTRELGIRRAIGAARDDIVRLVIARVGKVAAFGAGLGLGLALWASRAVESLLFGIEATDAWTFVAVGLASLLVAVGAGVAPALRASSVEPAVVLRSE